MQKVISQLKLKKLKSNFREWVLKIFTRSTKCSLLKLRFKNFSVVDIYDKLVAKLAASLFFWRKISDEKNFAD